MPKLAVLGHPVSHSRSPAMHTAALAALGLAGEWSYEAIDVEIEHFPALVRSLPEQGFAGVNVTVPHKVVAAELADELGDAAREIGAANTLSFRDGGTRADNTDAIGLLESLPTSPAGCSALVLGAGGSARACVWGLLRAGAEVHVWNRTESRARALADELGARLAVVDGGAARLGTGTFELIVNCTTVGMEGVNPSGDEGQPPVGQGVADLKGLPVSVDALATAKAVVDLVYGERETELIRAAREAGAATVDGLEVLVHQGAASLHRWTGLEPPLDAMRAAARE